MKVPEEHIERLCHRKHLYTSKKDAEFKIKAMRKRGKIVTVKPYKCNFCDWWHIGHERVYNPNYKTELKASDLFF